jgi:hypothetical protein
MMKSRRMRWAGHVAYLEVKRNAYMFLVVRPDGRLRLRWENNTEMDLREVGSHY